MRILFINPTATGEFDAYMEEQLGGCAGPDIDVVVRHLSLPDFPQTPFVPDDLGFLGPLLRTLSDAQDEGFDAAVVGCCDDFGILEARRALTMPVVGPLEAGLHLASLLHPRVALLVPDGFNSHILDRDLARIYGLDHIISETLIVPMGYPDEEAVAGILEGNRNDICAPFIGCHRTTLEGSALELARAAVDRGAGVIFPACTLWMGAMLEGFQANLGVPVIDPGRVAVLMAAAAARGKALFGASARAEKAAVAV